MNLATKNILRSIIQKFGTDIAYDSRLCDAYLSDLIPDFPAERHLLVTTVKNGLSAQLITDPSESNISSLVFQFAQTHNLPFKRADNLLRTWIFAFQDQPHTNPRSWPQKTKNYLQALVAGIVVLVISSAIAFYKPPELHMPEQNTIQESTSTPEPEQKRDTESVIKTIKDTPALLLEKSSSLPVKSEPAIKYLVSESILIRENIFLLKNKKSDLQALINLSEITQDEFYKKQQDNIKKSISNIEKIINQSTERYIKKLQWLCQLDDKNHHPESRKHLAAETQDRIEKSAINILNQHIKNCTNTKNFNAGNIKRELTDLAGEF